MSYDLWTEATRDLEAENFERDVAAARVAAADVWSFLAVSKTGTEYANRKALVEDRLVEAAPDPKVREAVEASFDGDFAKVIAQNRQARKRHSERIASRKTARFDDIVAYTYKADLYCPEHIIEAMGKHLMYNPNTPESSLDAIASDMGIDRYVEWSYDSGEFPKVVFRDQLSEFDGYPCAYGHGIEASRKTAGYLVVNTYTDEVVAGPFDTQEEASEKMMWLGDMYRPQYVFSDVPFAVADEDYDWQRQGKKRPKAEGEREARRKEAALPYGLESTDPLGYYFISDSGYANGPYSKGDKQTMDETRVDGGEYQWVRLGPLGIEEVPSANPTASRKTANERLSPHDLVGRGLLGFPNSEITKVQPGGDDWAGGGVTWYLTVKTEDGRELKVPKTITNFGDPTHGTYERKASKKIAKNFYIGDRVLIEDGEGDTGIVESGDGPHWYVRLDDGELTGPWSDDELSKVGSRKTASSKAVRGFFHDINGVNAYLVEVEHDPGDSYSRSVDPAGKKYWRQVGEAPTHNAIIDLLNAEFDGEKYDLPRKGPQGAKSVSYVVFVKPSDADRYNNARFGSRKTAYSYEKVGNDGGVATLNFDYVNSEQDLRYILREDFGVSRPYAIHQDGPSRWQVDVPANKVAKLAIITTQCAKCGQMIANSKKSQSKWEDVNDSTSCPEGGKHEPPPAYQARRQATAVTVRPKHEGREKRLVGWVVAEVQSPTSRREVKTFPSKSDALHFASDYANRHGYVLHKAVREALRKTANVYWKEEPTGGDSMRYVTQDTGTEYAASVNLYPAFPGEDKGFSEWRVTRNGQVVVEGEERFADDAKKAAEEALSRLATKRQASRSGYVLVDESKFTPEMHKRFLGYFSSEEEAKAWAEKEYGVPSDVWGDRVYVKDVGGSPEASRRVETAKRILRTGVSEQLEDGTLIDEVTAANLMRTYASLSESNRKRFDEVDPAKLVRFASRAATRKTASTVYVKPNASRQDYEVRLHHKTARFMLGDRVETEEGPGVVTNVNMGTSSLGDTTYTVDLESGGRATLYPYQMAYPDVIYARKQAATSADLDALGDDLDPDVLEQAEKRAIAEVGRLTPTSDHDRYWDVVAKHYFNMTKGAMRKSAAKYVTMFDSAEGAYVSWGPFDSEAAAQDEVAFLRQYWGPRTEFMVTDKSAAEINLEKFPKDVRVPRWQNMVHGG